MNHGFNDKTFLYKLGILFLDALLVVSAALGAYAIRFDFSIPPYYQSQIFSILPAFICIRITTLYHCRSYSGLRRFTSIDDILALWKGLLFGTLIFIVHLFFRSNSLSVFIAVVLVLSVVMHRAQIYWPTAGARKVYTYVILITALSSILFSFSVFGILASSAPLFPSEIPVIGNVLAIQSHSAETIPRSIILVELMLSIILLGLVRILPRIWAQRYSYQNKNTKIVLIYGADQFGEQFLKFIRDNAHLNYKPIGVIDEDKSRHRMYLHGLPVLGGITDIEGLAQKHSVDELLICTDSLTKENLIEIVNRCDAIDLLVRQIPSLSSVLDGSYELANFEIIDIGSLLGREEVVLDESQVAEYVSGKVILVTGAGGSIGSEICRQIVKFSPKELILLGRGENSIYQIHRELSQTQAETPFKCVIADVREKNRIHEIVRKNRPDVIFHAAAHKHVPFMEQCPEEAVMNNVFGTKNVCESADMYDVECVVLISTDKAVILSSIMGTTKRLAEIVVQQISRQSSTKYVTVRFGNVLGSRGSVVPLFESQIKSGGPVTVTDPQMMRYFMSIPEAVRLVLHSGAIGDNGDLCVLDMGSPVSVLSLAENMIRMAGKRPYQDIEISFTGLRPGESLTEQLFDENEEKFSVRVGKITVSKQKNVEVSAEYWTDLYHATVEQDADGVLSLMSKQLPKFQRKT